MSLQVNSPSVVEFHDIHAVHHDLDSARAWMSKICGPHRLKASSPQRIQFQHAGNVLKAMSTVIGYIEYGTDVTVNIDGGSALNSYSLSLPLNGEQELHSKNGLLVSDSSQGLIVSPFENQELCIAGNCRKILVAITRSAMHQMLDELLQRPSQVPIVFDSRMDANFGASAAWWRMVKFLLQELDQVRNFFGQLSIASDIERALIKSLILSQPNNYSDELAAALGIRYPTYLLKAKQFILDHAHEDVCLENLECAAGVSRFTLYESFKKYYGLSPMSFLKRHRLEGVRRVLLEGHSNLNVSAIAMEWGFNHLGRFSADYKKMFGEAPSQTVGRLRSH